MQLGELEKTPVYDADMYHGEGASNLPCVLEKNQGNGRRTGLDAGKRERYSDAIAVAETVTLRQRSTW